MRIFSILFLSLLLFGCETAEKIPQLPKLDTAGRVLCFGDSLTVGKGASAEESYPMQLGRLIGREVIRSGVSGEVSALGLKRLPEELRKHRPDLVVLIHGGNDILRRHSGNTTYGNLKQMIRLIRENGTSVVLIGVPGFGLNLKGPKAKGYYPQLAKEHSLPYDGETLPKLLYEKKYKSDSVHLNASGYRKLAEAVARLLGRAGAV